MKAVLYGLLLGGATAMSGFAAERADSIYRTGPEQALRDAAAVHAGAVSGLHRDVTASTQGSEPLPVSWIARAELTRTRAIKGPVPPDPLPIMRVEQSSFAMAASGEPGWVSAYGDLRDGGVAVVFDLGHMLVVPSGEGESNVMALVMRAAQIDAIADDAERRATRLGWITNGPTDADRRAALRSSLQAGASWDDIAGAVKPVWPKANPALKDFFTGMIAFAMINGFWSVEDSRPLEFLCRAFLDADERAAPTTMLQLRQVLNWADRVNAPADRALAIERIVACYRTKSAEGLANSLQPYYDQLDPKYGL